jgi:hypothetical protein
MIPPTVRPSHFAMGFATRKLRLLPPCTSFDTRGRPGPRFEIHRQ